MTFYSLGYKLYASFPIKPFKKQVGEIYRRIQRNNSLKGTVVVKREGIFYELDLSESIDNSIYHLGCHEPKITKTIKRICRRGMTVIDVGANIGAHTFRFAKLVGVNGRVIAFEPTPWAFRKLERNFAMNDFRNIELVRMAVSNTIEYQKEVVFSSSWPLEYSEESAECHPCHHGHIVKDTVDFCTLDRVIKEKGVKKVDLIKIDVDGYELKVCRGGAAILREQKPVIVIEIGKPTMEEVGDSPRELVKMLFELGYGFYSVRDLKRYGSVNAVADRIEQMRVENFVLSVSALK